MFFNYQSCFYVCWWSHCWRSKTQSVTALSLSSTEAEFCAAVSATKFYLFICHVLKFLGGHHPTVPTTVYEDNEACINVIDTRHPTERTHHIEKP